MGGFARVALPVATAVLLPEAAAVAGIALPGVATGMSWTNIALAGLQGLGSAMTYANQQQAANQQAMARNQQIAYMQRQQQIQAQQQRDKLKRLVAAERARFGAMGTGSQEGSAAALIQGLRQKTENDIAIGRQQTLMRQQNLLDQSHPAQRLGFQALAKVASPMVSLLQDQ